MENTIQISERFSLAFYCKLNRLVYIEFNTNQNRNITMKTFKSMLLAVSVIAIAAPAMAGGFTFELPRLTFPEPKPVVSSQSCTSSATLTTVACSNQ